MEISIFTLWYFLVSLFSGVLAGMGMGGGTLLIPALTLLLGVEHTLAQSINLIVFVPSAIIAIIIYSKDHLIDYKQGWIVALPATVVSGLAAVFALKISSEVLSIIFGAFIATIGLVQIVVFCVRKIKSQHG